MGAFIRRMRRRRRRRGDSITAEEEGRAYDGL
jgi:hypothetical protein